MTTSEKPLWKINVRRLQLMVRKTAPILNLLMKKADTELSALICQRSKDMTIYVWQIRINLVSPS